MHRIQESGEVCLPHFFRQMWYSTAVLHQVGVNVFIKFTTVCNAKQIEVTEGDFNASPCTILLFKI
jgi:hypothetical protein